MRRRPPRSTTSWPWRRTTSRTCPRGTRSRSSTPSPQQIVGNLAAPDLLTLEEVQDNNGTTNDGTVAADETLRLLTEAILRAGGPAYEWRQIDPVDGAEGGQPGGNIRVAFLFRTDRGLKFIDRGTPSSTEGTEVPRTTRARRT